MKKLENVYLKTGDKFRVKIGINSGPVIAGVVGEHKP
jgi:class 3 adenylate cyclase